MYFFDTIIKHLMKRLSLFTQRVDEVVFFDRSGRYFMGRCGSLLWCLTAHVAFMLFREWIMELHFFLPCFKSLTSKSSYPSLCVVKRKQKKNRFTRNNTNNIEHQNNSRSSNKARYKKGYLDPIQKNLQNIFCNFTRLHVYNTS